MELRKRGQVSLEFMLVFGLMLILLLYSVNNVTFKEGSASTENLRIQISLEEKNLANVISNTVSQVYSQGPGSKSTAYVRLTYLRDRDMLLKGLGVEDPKVFVTYGNYTDSGNGTYVTVTGKDSTPVLSGGDKNVFWSRALYGAVLYNRSDVWSPRGSLTIGGVRIYGLELDPADVPAILRVVVEWNPDKPDLWTFDQERGELRININPGG
ncbi:hypothetical protein A3L12_03220 [Thermococcus sp. P6]|uniref:class III signal peptide-containing protein n=1 Tax=Thermococcus sp. P6 TaxID=122420 RepID=UPI000B598E44|nr:class III signal peptide-containing protein [Thermococcus sp. P6]ASJ10379.1 hypothetical protein A3L12_03220 [Thermococcus sp. P6]